jgi:HlyD family secretion protein
MKFGRTACIIIIAFCAIIWLIWWVSEPIRTPGKLVLYGNVDVRQVDIGFRVPGLVAKMPFEEGDIVSKGVLVAEIDKTPYDSQVRQATANVASVRASFANAQRLLKRRQALVKEGAVAQEDVETAATNLEQLNANLAAAQAELVVAMDNLAYTEAFAPTDGVILTRIREPGSVVKESDPVYTISISSPVWIRAFVAETHLGDVYYGMPAEITTDSKALPTYYGKVGFISPLAEFTPKTVETTELRTDLVYRLRIYVDNPDHYLKQGMPVTVTLKLPGKREKHERAAA